MYRNHKTATRFFALFFLSLISLLFVFKQDLTRELTISLKPSPENELLSKDYINRIIEIGDTFDENPTTAIWDNKPVSLPPANLSYLLNQENGAVLGAPSGEKWIEVDLDKQKVYAREGNNLIYEFAISSGKPWTPTVTGEFYIWYKVRSQLMTGGTGSDYYYLPNVPFVQYFYKGYSFHGTYWHNDFGHPRSHGCVNMSIPDSEKLYNWADPAMPEGQRTFRSTAANPGTRVVVHGKTPPMN